MLIINNRSTDFENIDSFFLMGIPVSCFVDNRCFRMSGVVFRIVPPIGSLLIQTPADMKYLVTAELEKGLGVQ